MSAPEATTTHLFDATGVTRDAPTPICRGLASVVGECVVWDAGTQELCWLDIEGRRFYRHRWGAEHATEYVTEERIGAIGILGGGVYLAGAETGFGHIRPENGVLSQRLSSDYSQDAKRLVRLNDGRTDRQGRFVCGGFNSENCDTPAWQPGVGVFRAAPARHAHRLLDVDVCGANGTCFSPAGDIMYFTDSPQRKLLRFAYGSDVDKLRMADAEVVADLDTLGIEEGVFDGACVDSEGNMWVCICFGGVVLHLEASTGKLLQRIELPVKRPTCPALAGPDLDMLVISSIGPPIVQGAELEAHPLSGELFGIRVDTPGLPEPTVVLQD